MSRAYLTIEKQIAAMKADWPRFVARSVNRSAQRAKWVGDVKPQFSRFTLEVRYTVGKFPETRILNPELARLPENLEGSLPHVYPPADDPQLCLFDPDEGQWSPAMLISRSILPWAIDWICC